jgi:hypothetical protein
MKNLPNIFSVLYDFYMTKKIKSLDGSLRRHVEAKRELRKKQLVAKILESESDKKIRLRKEKRKRVTLQNRLNKDVRKIESADTSLGEMHSNKDFD